MAGMFLPAECMQHPGCACVTQTIDQIRLETLLCNTNFICSITFLCCTKEELSAKHTQYIRRDLFPHLVDAQSRRLDRVRLVSLSIGNCTETTASALEALVSESVLPHLPSVPVQELVIDARQNALLKREHTRDRPPSDALLTPTYVRIVLCVPYVLPTDADLLSKGLTAFHHDVAFPSAFEASRAVLLTICSNRILSKRYGLSNFVYAGTGIERFAHIDRGSTNILRYELDDCGTVARDHIYPTPDEIVAAFGVPVYAPFSGDFCYRDRTTGRLFHTQMVNECDHPDAMPDADRGSTPLLGSARGNALMRCWTGLVRVLGDSFDRANGDEIEALLREKEMQQRLAELDDDPNRRAQRLTFRLLADSIRMLEYDRRSTDVWLEALSNAMSGARTVDIIDLALWRLLSDYGARIYKEYDTPTSDEVAVIEVLGARLTETESAREALLVLPRSVFRDPKLCTGSHETMLWQQQTPLIDLWMSLPIETFGPHARDSTFISCNLLDILNACAGVYASLLATPLHTEESIDHANNLIDTLVSKALLSYWPEVDPDNIAGMRLWVPLQLFGRLISTALESERFRRYWDSAVVRA